MNKGLEFRLFRNKPKTPLKKAGNQDKSARILHPVFIREIFPTRLNGNEIGESTVKGNLLSTQEKNMSQPISLNSQNNYEIKVAGRPNNSWLDLFGGAKTHVEILEDGIEVTTISNVVMDQAGLIGLIRRWHGLGIVLLSIRKV